MLLLPSLPDRGSVAAAQFDSYCARSAPESWIVWGRARRADVARYPGALAIRAVWGGTQYCHVNARTIAVDDDNFLILNEGTACSTSIDADYPVETLTIGFRPGPGDSFDENLRPHDRVVSPVLQFIRAHLARGLVDEGWYEEQLEFLRARMHHGQRRLHEQTERLESVRTTTRHEVRRRIAMATDYLHTYYSRKVSLAMLARTACLSKFHFLRLFTLMHGVTPHAYLQRKRVNVAVRLLESTRMSVAEIAANVGFAFESTLLRQVRRHTQLSPRELRARHLEGAAA